MVARVMAAAAIVDSCCWSVICLIRFGSGFSILWSSGMISALRLMASSEPCELVSLGMSFAVMWMLKIPCRSGVSGLYMIRSCRTSWPVIRLIRVRACSRGEFEPVEYCSISWMAIARLLMMLVMAVFSSVNPVMSVW